MHPLFLSALLLAGQPAASALDAQEGGRGAPFSFPHPRCPQPGRTLGCARARLDSWVAMANLEQDPQPAEQRLRAVWGQSNADQTFFQLEIGAPHLPTDRAGLLILNKSIFGPPREWRGTISRAAALALVDAVAPVAAAAPPPPEVCLDGGEGLIEVVRNGRTDLSEAGVCEPESPMSAAVGRMTGMAHAAVGGCESTEEAYIGLYRCLRFHGDRAQARDVWLADAALWRPAEYAGGDAVVRDHAVFARDGLGVVTGVWGRDGAGRTRPGRSFYEIWRRAPDGAWRLEGAEGLPDGLAAGASQPASAPQDPSS